MAENNKMEISFSKRTAKIESKPNATQEELLDLILSKQQDDLIPWEDCQLPSLGRYYGGKIPGGIIQVRPMGLYADKIMATQRLAKAGKSIDWLYRKCTKIPNNFDPLDLLAQDRTFLLYYLRGITHGNEYDFILNCPNEVDGEKCNHIIEATYDLNKLASTIKYPNDEIGEEPFKIVLPYLTSVLKQEFSVKVRFMRGRDIFEILDVHQDRTKGKRQDRNKEALDETIEQNLNLVVIEAMGSTDKNKIKSLIGKMHSQDTAVIRSFLNQHTPGIDSEIELECEQCKYEMKIDLPITDTFFRPKSK